MITVEDRRTRRNVKLATDNWKLLPRHTRGTGGPRSGVALIITLTIMALLLIMATAFMVNMRSERQVSFNYRRQVEARQAALAGLHTAIAKMGRFYTDAEAVNGSVATMAGRFYYTNGSGSATVSAPGITSYTAYPTNNILMFSWIKGSVYTPGATNWADKVNLNIGNYKWPPSPTQSGIYLPIANPSVNPVRAGTSGTSWGPDKPGIWAAYMNLPSSGTGCKFAFWIDDESSKINISNAAVRDLKPDPCKYNNNTTNIWTNPAFPTPTDPSACPKYPCAMIVQPDPAKGKTKQLSSVDLTLLDTEVVSPGYGYNPDGRNWDLNTVAKMEEARNTGTWQPFQSPEELLSLDNRLTMNDYQAVKSCLTAWSVENEDRAQMFRNATGSLVVRTNVGVTITTQADAKRLYDFLLTTCNLTNSPSLMKFFNNATFGNVGGKYPDISQPFINGGCSQIVANIVAYVSDPTVVAPPGSTPPFCPDINPAWDFTSTNLPSGACGLWKAAYMNEIAVALCWQPIQPPPATKPQYQLWASCYIELVNPYEVAMPRLSITPKEEYRIYLDTTPVKVTCTAPSATPTSLIGSGTTNIVMGYTDAVSPHSYQEPKPVNCFSWKVGGPQTNVPPLTAINIALPQIRQTMLCGMGNKGIIDWSRQTNMAVTLMQPRLAALTSDPQAPPPTASEFWDQNITPAPARWSIAKNDPRVHVWYGPYAGSGVTIKGYGSASGQNSAAVNFTGGDSETVSGTSPNANRPEYRSNFVIAEGGMTSIGELGFIHTGKPWRSLSLQYYGAQSDETGTMGSSTRAIPDWAMLDILAVNTPPIYGRVNINAGGWHLGNNGYGPYQRSYPNCPTFEDRQYFPPHPNLLAVWSGAANASFFTAANYYWSYQTTRTSAYNGYGYPYIGNPVTQPTVDAASVPLAAALNVIPDYRFRNKLANYICYYYHPTNPTHTTFAPQGDPSDTSFDPSRDIYNPYYTVGQICEIQCMNYLFTGNGTQIAYTDADKEDTLRRIINVLTTRGDAFTIHAAGYADGGEARLMAVVERSRDPLAPLVINRNKFRIRQVRWISD
ncbi:MAG: hypothetical protein NTY01_06255 [Verrucomicrobia bacterium]|nr:hypothetical protein [Verrucomicrobiota bacterium]